MIHISSDWSDLDSELDRLESLPNGKAKKILDLTLRGGFLRTQADVHVETESLKSSGKSKSETNKTLKTWEGVIKYGGPSKGVNNPVDYAIYEKRRGVHGAGGPSDAKGDHDFMRSTELLGPKWVAAILGALKK